MGPLSGPHVTVGLRDAPGDSHQEGKGAVGCGIREDAGGVGDVYPPFRSGVHVNVIESDCVVAYDLQLTPGIHDFGVDCVGEEGQKAVHVSDLREEELVWDCVVHAFEDLNLGVALQDPNSLVEKLPSNICLWSCHLTSHSG